MISLKRFKWVLAVVAVACCAQAHAQVLDQVPGDAIAVFKIRNLSAVNAKAIKLAAAWGLDQMVPDFKDPLAAGLEKAHLGAGVNKDGDSAVAFMHPEEGEKKRAEIIWLMPTADYKAFVGNFKDAKEEGEVTTATMPDEPSKPIYISHWGDYAAMTPEKDLLDKKPGGFKVNGQAKKESDSKDAVLFANMDELRKVALPKLKGERPHILDQMTQELAKQPATAKYVPVLKALVSLYLDAVENFIEQGTNGVFSFDLADDGIATSLLAEFKPGTDYATTISQLRGSSNGSLLAGLPDRKYFAFGGFAADPKVMERIAGKIIDPLTQELEKTDDEQAKKFGSTLAVVKNAAGSVKSGVAAYVVPTGALGQESVIQAFSIATGDAATIAKANRELITGMSELFKNAPQDKVSMALDYKPQAKTVDGVSLDHYQVQLNTDPNDPKAAQAQQAIAMVYGPNGMGGDMGVVTPEKYITVVSGTDQLLSDVIAAAKNPQDVLNNQPGVRAVSSHLPKQRVAEYYIALDNIVTSVAHYAAGFGFAVKFHLPPNLPPIGVAVATEGPSIRFDSFIPSELVQNMISAALEVQQGMQGGAGGGGPGGL